MERRRDQAQRDRATIAQLTNNSQNDFFPPAESLFKPPSKVCNFIGIASTKWWWYGWEGGGGVSDRVLKTTEIQNV